MVHRGHPVARGVARCSKGGARWRVNLTVSDAFVAQDQTTNWLWAKDSVMLHPDPAIIDQSHGQRRS